MRLAPLLLILVAGPASAKHLMVCSARVAGADVALHVTWDGDAELQVRGPDGIATCTVPVDSTVSDGDRLVMNVGAKTCDGPLSSTLADAPVALSWPGWQTWSDGQGTDHPVLHWSGTTRCEVVFVDYEVLSQRWAPRPPACTDLTVVGVGMDDERVDLSLGWPDGGAVRVHVFASESAPSEYAMIEVQSTRGDMAFTDSVGWSTAEEGNTGISARNLFRPGEAQTFTLTPQGGEPCTVTTLPAPGVVPEEL